MYMCEVDGLCKKVQTSRPSLDLAQPGQGLTGAEVN